MTKEQRKAISERMKAYWVKKRKSEPDAGHYMWTSQGPVSETILRVESWKFCPYCGRELK